jgi:hypothetical protein
MSVTGDQPKGPSTDQKPSLSKAQEAGVLPYKSDAPAAGPRMATIQDDDERLLARIGYRQVRYSDVAEISPIDNALGTS